MVAELEHPEQTAHLCLQLFSALGVKGVSIQDIDIAHQVPSMKPSNQPNAIDWNFVRRLAKDQLMGAGKKVGGLKAEELGFAADINVKHLNSGDLGREALGGVPWVRKCGRLPIQENLVIM